MRLPSSRRRRWTELLEFVRASLRGKQRLEAQRYASWAGAILADASESLAQAVTVALPWMQAWRKRNDVGTIGFLIQDEASGVAAALRIALSLAEQLEVDLADCCQPQAYEELLAVADRNQRRRRGVYYTPPEIAGYIVRSVDCTLAQMGIAAGLADMGTDTFGEFSIRILDPAAGSGVFLTEIIQAVYRRMTSTWRDAGDDEQELAARWNDYVARSLLPRMAGWEIMPAAVVAAHCLLADTLRATGYRFVDSPPLELHLRDALALPGKESPFPVIIGNPPYASLSTARHGWIESLIRSPQSGYMQIDGRPLGEKKHWLHDDYVKFLRFAQWHVEQSGWGVVGMVTNHGYLENASFRGMRQSLLGTFDQVRVVDLHGNAKRGERSPDGSRDENVFGIASGAAIGTFARAGVHASACPASANTLKRELQREVEHSELWGTRDQKLARLKVHDIAKARFTPTGPHYRFTPQTRSTSREYDRAWQLCDAMPFNSTAPVTARDRFVIALTREELLQRMEFFCDLSVPDDVIRSRYFDRTRSSKYSPGDSRGWKLGEARHILAADPTWPDRIVLCQYRPLDYRWALWHDALVDWPRPELSQQLLDHDNLALIARRQSPRGLPANFFWATRTLALDGIVRSDNCGSESLFPVWRYENGARAGNFAPAFIMEMERATGLTSTHLTPLSLAGYIYGLFWSPEYRTRYQHELTCDFPRIVPPPSADDFIHVSERGKRLLELHTQVPDFSSPSSANGFAKPIAAGYPRWLDGRIWIDAVTPIAEMEEEAWNFRVGAHQVAKKWLAARREMKLEGTAINCLVTRIRNLLASCRI